MCRLHGFNRKHERLIDWLNDWLIDWLIDFRWPALQLYPGREQVNVGKGKGKERWTVYFDCQKKRSYGHIINLGELV